MTTNNEAKELLDSRLAVYGDRKKNMEDVANVWSGILGVTVRPDQVPLLMSGYKLVRASNTPDYADNIDDSDGYNEMFREIIGDDMIHARTTDEYLAIKQERGKDFSNLPCPECGLPKQHKMDCSYRGLQPVRPEEACTNCRSTNCEGGCEDDDFQQQQDIINARRLQAAAEHDEAYQRLVSNIGVGPAKKKPHPVSLQHSRGPYDPVLAQEIKHRFGESNAFLLGHAEAAIVAAQTVAMFQEQQARGTVFDEHTKGETSFMEAGLKQMGRLK